MSSKELTDKFTPIVNFNKNTFYYELFSMEDLYALSKVNKFFQKELHDNLLKSPIFLATQITRRLIENLHIPKTLIRSNLIIESFYKENGNSIKVVSTDKNLVHQIIFGSSNLWLKFITNEYNEYNKKYVLLGNKEKFLFTGPNIDKITNYLIELLLIEYLKINRQQ